MTNPRFSLVEIFCVLAARLGLIHIAIDHFDRADDEDLAGTAWAEKGVALPKRNFRLVDLDDSFEGFPHRVDHRPPQMRTSWVLRPG